MGIAALNDQQHLQQTVADTLKQREVLETYCVEKGWDVAPSAANFVLVQVGELAETIYTQLKQQGILIRWWDNDIMRSFVRITVGTADQQQRLFNAIDNILE